MIIGADGLHPVFAKVVDILVLVDLVVLHVCHYDTDYFDDHYHAYAIVPSDSHIFALMNSFIPLYCMHIRKMTIDIWTV